jgi:Tol biopolymer transport system component
MGEVYRARDTRLNRTVAIKVLPRDFSEDADRRQRFEREARLIASLSHPHICSLHDIGSEAAHAFLVMEHLEGETLADRIARGPLPLSDVLRYGREIATALDAAHRQGITHRDLKPGNVMLTRSGAKLLDFGLAKVVEPVSNGVDRTTRVVTNATVAGAVLGTVPYMAPEVLEGRPADARSDIFALGAVLYEMSTGRPAFPGASAAAVTSAIMTSEPPAIAVTPMLDSIVRTALEKDRERRWSSAHDVALQLETLQRRRDAPATGGGAVSRLPWILVAVLTAGVVLALMWGTRRGPGASQQLIGRAPAVVAFPLIPPPGGAFTASVEWTAIAVSPDGSAIAYSARDAEGTVKLWLRRIDSLEARPAPGAEGATSMFWSPDGRSLAFFAGGKLKRLDVAGGAAPVVICDARDEIGQTGTWGADGRILFASVQGEALLAVDASGGAPTEIRKTDASGAQRLTWPTFLPDGRSYLYLASLRNDTGAVMFSPQGGEPRKVLDVRSNVQYVDPGYLLYAREGSLTARRFDPRTGSVTGDPILVSERVRYFRPTGLAHFAASTNGVIAYQHAEDQSRIATFDRTGRQLADVRTSGEYIQGLSLSSDWRRLLYERIDPRTSSLDIWVLELERGVETRVTNDPRTDAFPLWGPAGSVIFSVAAGSAPRLFRRDLNTGRERELSPHGGGLQRPTSVSPEGHLVLYAQRTARGNFDLMVRRLADNSTVPYRESAADESDGRFSPDGRLVAFVSDESGRPQVMVAPFPSGPATPVSIAGGRSPRWSPDGRALFFVAADGELMSAPVRVTTALDVGRPSRLFSTRTPEGPWSDFAVMPDGRFFAIVQTRLASQQPMNVIVNWPASLSR